MYHVLSHTAPLAFGIRHSRINEFHSCAKYDMHTEVTSIYTLPFLLHKVNDIEYIVREQSEWTHTLCWRVNSCNCRWYQCLCGAVRNAGHTATVHLKCEYRLWRKNEHFRLTKNAIYSIIENWNEPHFAYGMEGDADLASKWICDRNRRTTFVTSHRLFTHICMRMKTTTALTTAKKKRKKTKRTKKRMRNGKNEIIAFLSAPVSSKCTRNIKINNIVDLWAIAFVAYPASSRCARLQKKCNSHVWLCEQNMKIN